MGGAALFYRGAGNFRPEISSAARCRFENREEKRKALYRGARGVKEFLDLRERASSRRADDFGPKNTRDLYKVPKWDLLDKPVEISTGTPL